MTPHGLLLTIFLIAFVLIGLIFLVVYRSSHISEDQGLAHAKKNRGLFFLILLGVLLILLTVTIPKSPYFIHATETPSQVVYVVAQQFSFVMTHDHRDPKKPGGSDKIAVEAGELVEFRVTAKDVNHGFGVYDQHYHLITQTQAMPGYVNRLRWVFDEPGEYHILCLEYCGAAHHNMKSSFTVN